MLTIQRKKRQQYLYLVPGEENMAKWELFDHEELERRIENGSLEEGCKLFRVDKEINVRFETVVHLD